jgi:hypothetical protein
LWHQTSMGKTKKDAAAVALGRLVGQVVVIEDQGR